MWYLEYHEGEGEAEEEEEEQFGEEVDLHVEQADLAGGLARVHHTARVLPRVHHHPHRRPTRQHRRAPHRVLDATLQKAARF